VTNNGSPIARDAAVTLTSLSGLVYTGSVTPGVDKIWLKAFDGTWSNWTEADLTDQGLAPAVVTATNQSVSYNQSLSFSNIFSVSGSGITQYQVYFSYPEGGAPALGTVTNNGSPIARDAAVTLTSLSGLVYTGSVTPGVDKIWLKAFDGVWSNWTEADLTDQGLAPAVVTGTNQSVSYNQSVSFSNIFSVSGSGITQYQVYFSYPEGGAPALGIVMNNGSPIAQDAAVTLTSLSGLVYKSSAMPGVDKIWLKAYDGIWSNWTEADLTDQASAQAGASAVSPAVNLDNEQGGQGLLSSRSQITALSLLGNYMASTFAGDGHFSTPVADASMRSSDQNAFLATPRNA
jgi:phosphohistidine swiveling domain-containing protein